MYVAQMDVVSAACNKEDLVCKLKKPLYGLKQSGQEWYRKLDTYLLSIRGQRTEIDPCVYTFNKNSSKVILVYVDGMILASRKQNELIKLKMKLEFKMQDLGPINHILGIDIERDELTGKFFLSQEQNVKTLVERFNMTEAKEAVTPKGNRTSKSRRIQVLKTKRNAWKCESDYIENLSVD